MIASRQDLRNAINALAYRQSGYFTAAQALELGYSYQAQKHHADRGNWVRVDRGLFRLPQWPTGPEDSFARWSVWAGSSAVVSHESALAAHGLSDIDPPLLHLTVPPGFAARDDAIVLHHATLDESETEQRQGWRITTPLRTIIDVAATTTSQETIDRAVADGLREGKLTRRQILRATDAASAESALRVERALSAAERDTPA